MANGNLDKFLDSWKELETIMRTKHGMEVREWEEKHEGKVEAERLKVCRIIRNYVAHNDTNNFISKIDTTTIKWIKAFTKELKKGNKKTKVVKVKPIEKVVKKTKTKRR